MSLSVAGSTGLEYSKYTRTVAEAAAIATGASQGSALRNREYICDVLKKYVRGPQAVFEVGTGTADQTVYFSQHLPEVTWQTSDRKIYHDTIKETLATAWKTQNLPEGRLKEPVTFDIDEDEIEGAPYDVIYASNVVHCIPWESFKNLFRKAATALKIDGLFILYGPFNIKDPSSIEGIYTSAGNQSFDKKLKAQDPLLGLREIGDIKALAAKNSFDFASKHDDVQRNNYILIFKKAVC